VLFRSAKREVAPRLAARDRLEALPEKPAAEAQGRRADASANAAAPPPAAPAAAPAAAPSLAKTAGAGVAGLAEDKKVGGVADAVSAQSAGAESRVASGPPRERKLPVPGRVGPPPDPTRLAAERYQSLLAKRPATAADARALRDGWEAFARDQPSGPHADEARVRAIEAGATAWGLGGEAADLARARAAAQAYLASPDAPQRLRVRGVLEALPD